MAVENISTSTTSTIYENPNSKLQGTEFLQLFLTELQHQDPTEPMKNEQILEQTAQLSNLETNEALKKSLDVLTNSLQTSSQFNAISAIGRTANTGNDTVTIEDGESVSFGINFQEPIQAGSISIIDDKGNIVKTMDLDKYAGRNGTIDFNWDAKSGNGSSVTNGEYKVVADYLDTNNKSQTISLGEYLVESVKFDKGKAFLKLDNNYVAFDDVKEIY